MSSDDQIYTSRTCSNFQVILFGFVVFQTKVTEGYYNIAILFFFQIPGSFFSFFNRIKVFQTCVTSRRYQTGKIYAQSDNTNTCITLFENLIGHKETLKWSSTHIVVAVNKGKGSLLNKSGQVVHALVKLMITQGGSIVAHTCHQFHFRSSPIEIEEIGRAHV